MMTDSAFLSFIALLGLCHSKFDFAEFKILFEK